MKTRLAKFYRSLACRVALAMVATASAAKAHDLPHHFPLAPTDWGMIQQDCMGHREAQQYSLPSTQSNLSQGIELAVTPPDAGSPPIPPQYFADQHFADQAIASTELVGSGLYDRVDCAQLEAFYRTPLNAELVEYTPVDSANQSEVKALVSNTQPEVDADSWKLDKSFFAACSCDFESRQAEPSSATPAFVFHNVRIADYFRDLSFVGNRVLRHEQVAAPNWVSPLAVAVPTVQLQNKQRFADGLAELATWDCILQNELFQFSGAARAGKLAANVANAWYATALPVASKAIADLANSLSPATPSVSPKFEKRQLAQSFGSKAPMFIIYPTAGGNEVAIPVAQARQFVTSKPAAQPSSVSPEFKQLVETTNARLQWAGGRLSEAAGFMNGWFSERVARVRNSELR